MTKVCEAAAAIAVRPLEVRFFEYLKKAIRHPDRGPAAKIAYLVLPR